jgi:futalosine hydrolase
MTVNKPILVVTAVKAEKDAVLRGLIDKKNIEVIEVGVGQVEAAARTTVALSQQQYSIVINAGIAGGFVGKAEIGSTVIADQIIAADLGAESPEGFISLDDLGFGLSTIEVNKDNVNKVYKKALEAGVNVHKGAILTVSTVTGTSESAVSLERRIPTATAEAMEGFGVATAAKQFNVPMLEIRTISNKVGPRNKEEWKFKEALQALEETFSKIKEVLS